MQTDKTDALCPPISLFLLVSYKSQRRITLSVPPDITNRLFFEMHIEFT